MVVLIGMKVHHTYVKKYTTINNSGSATGGAMSGANLIQLGSTIGDSTNGASNNYGMSGS